MDNKLNTLKIYEEIAYDYEDLTNSFLSKYLINDLDNFLYNLKGKEILDIGSGGGRDSLYFKEKGFKPLCLDFSETMIEICKKKGLNGIVCDFEEMNFKNENFDGVWSYTSLLHIPKNKIVRVLEKIYDILKKEGIFYIGMKKGEGEYIKKESKYGIDGRYFALYEFEELNLILENIGFRIIKNSEILHSNGNKYIGILCKK